MKEKGSYVMSVMDGFDAGFYALVKHNKRKLHLQMYDFNLKQKFDQRLTLPAEALEKKMNYEKIVPLGDKAMICASTGDMSTRKSVGGVGLGTGFYEASSWIMNSDGSINSTTLALLKVKQNVTTVKDKVGFVANTAASKLLAYYVDYQKNSRSIEFHFSITSAEVYTVKMSKKFTYSFPFKMASAMANDLHVHSVAMGHEDVFALIQISEKDKARDSDYNTFYKLLRFNISTGEMKEIDIDLHGKYLKSMTMYIDQDENIFVGGIYGKGVFGGYLGCFSYQVSAATNNVQKELIEDFDKDFLLNFIKEKRINSGKGIQDDYYSLYDFTMNNGKGILIYQSVYSYSVVTEDASGKTTKTTYEYDDLILIHFNMATNTISEYRIPKKQRTEDDGAYYSSYKLLETDKSFYVLYNDNPKNLELQKGKSAAKMNKAKVSSSILATLDKETGVLTKRELFQNSKLPVELAPRQFIMDNSGNIIVYGDARKIYKFGKVAP